MASSLTEGWRIYCAFLVLLSRGRGKRWGECSRHSPSLRFFFFFRQPPQHYGKVYFCDLVFLWSKIAWGGKTNQVAVYCQGLSISEIQIQDTGVNQAELLDKRDCRKRQKLISRKFWADECFESSHNKIQISCKILLVIWTAHAVLHLMRFEVRQFLR